VTPNVILKVCGITNQPDADAAIAAGATAIGFNFYPKSPRYLAPESAARFSTPGALRVGVFVNEPAARIAEIAALASLDVAQLHGDETPAQYPAGIAVWKAARVSADFSFSQ
jgi:phosphoribosylanthranilate isomerase